MIPHRTSSEVPAEQAEPGLPWRRLAALLRPVRLGLSAMAALTILGSLSGLVVPLGLGALVNALAASQRGAAAAWAGAIAAAVVASAVAFAVSDGLYARQTARLFRHVRLLMFEGVLRRRPSGSAAAAGLASRFVSDVEGLEELTVAALDAGVLAVVELGAALVALGLFDPWTLVVSVAVMAAAALAARRSQRSLASAGRDRQEALEGMSRTLGAALAARAGGERSRRVFARAAERVLRSEVRLGWLQAANRQGSGALAGLAPVAVVVVAAFGGSFRAGTLLTLYLLAERAFSGADSLLDLRLDVQLVRGVVRRCFELIDLGEAAPALPRRVPDPEPSLA